MQGAGFRLCVMNRILANGDFLKRGRKRLNKEEILCLRVEDLEVLIRRAVLYYGIKEENMIETLNKSAREAGNVFICFTDKYL